MNATVIKPPTYLDAAYDNKTSIFLAGSIEQGTAEEWQNRVINDLKDFYINIFNPRRDECDSAWLQSKDNAVFTEQVNWELTHLYKADIAAFYFDPNTKSPITLMELGLMLGEGIGCVCVYCPTGYYRKGNVDITCNHHGLCVFEDYNEWIDEIRNAILVDAIS